MTEAANGPRMLLGVPYPVSSSAAVSAAMRGNKRSETKPERAIRSLLHGRGYRFRKDFLIDVERLRVRADVAFTRQRIAVFVDGCFWHRCPEHGNRPRANAEYWSKKLDGNVARDRRVNDALRTMGWTVIRIWEHEAPEDAANAVAELVDVPPVHRSP
jgi:DNA mismatch endonuclease (patch repair protein)